MNASCAIDSGEDTLPELISRPRPQPAETPHAAKPIAAGSRINMQIARAVSMELLRRGDSKKRQLDIELMPTQWILERWAVSIGNGLKNPDVDQVRVSNVPPLDDATAICVDQIIMSLPGAPKSDARGLRLGPSEVGSMHDIVRRWFKSPEPCSSIASNYGISTDGVYARLRRALEACCTLFRAAGLRV